MFTELQHQLLIKCQTAAENTAAPEFLHKNLNTFLGLVDRLVDIVITSNNT